MSPEEKRRRNTIACRKWALSHPEKRKEINKRAIAKAIADGRYAERHRRARVKNPEVNSRATKKWRENNLEKSKALIKAWEKNNPERRAEIDRRRRARKKGSGGNVTAEQFSSLIEELYGTCFYCGDWEKPLTMDRMTPLSRGGPHHVSNIVPACKSCNCRKSTRTAEEWLAIITPKPPPPAPPLSTDLF